MPLNNAQRALILTRQDRLLSSLERPFRNEVAREKNRFIAESIPYIISHRKVSDAAYEQHSANMQAIFEKHYGRAINSFRAEVTRQAKDFIPDLELKRTHPPDFLLSVWVTKYGAARAKQTASTTREDIRRALQTALDAEEGVSEQALVRQLLKARQMTRFRADAIARTETHNAAMFASKETAKEITAETGQQLKKEWIPATDERVREDHARMSGHPPVGLDGVFEVGGERLDRPGDPAGSPETTINCRCVMGYSA